MVKLFVCDIDGTLTDGSVYYSKDGLELMKFSVIDGKGFELLRNKGIKILWITSSNNEIILKRAKDLKIDYLSMGNKNKLNTLKELKDLHDLKWNEISYIGDDINDIECLERVGIKACPKWSQDNVKQIKGIITLNSNNPIREFMNLILKEKE